jgi:hypothetical protein
MKGEDLYVRNIENDIRALKMGTKTPSELTIGLNLNHLKKVNEALYDDLLKKYKVELENFKKKNK